MLPNPPPPSRCHVPYGQVVTSTAEPKGAFSPGAGLWESMKPDWAGVHARLVETVSLPSVRLSLFSAADAPVVVRPMTLGTRTLHTPDDVMSTTAVPAFTGWFAAGLVLTTSPDATVLEHCVLGVGLTVSPSWPIACAACTVVLPLRSGIGKVDPGWRRFSLSLIHI